MVSSQIWIQGRTNVIQKYVEGHVFQGTTFNISCDFSRLIAFSEAIRVWNDMHASKRQQLSFVNYLGELLLSIYTKILFSPNATGWSSIQHVL